MKKKGRAIISILLTLVMAFSLLPVSSLAEEREETESVTTADYAETVDSKTSETQSDASEEAAEAVPDERISTESIEDITEYTPDMAVIPAEDAEPNANINNKFTRQPETNFSIYPDDTYTIHWDVNFTAQNFKIYQKVD